MTPLKVLFLGSTSFSGLWFIRALAKKGHKVIATTSQPFKNYQDPLRKERLHQLQELTNCEQDIVFGSPKFFSFLEKHQDADLFAFHFSFMQDYRKPSYDYQKGFVSATREMPEFFQRFSKNKTKSLVYTGTVFEPDEGEGSDNLRGYSPYGVTKRAIFEFVRYYCQIHNVNLGKFVIPNPFGPWEEPKMSHVFMQTWKKGEVAKLTAPDYTRDNIHVSLMAELYVQFCEKLCSGSDRFIKIGPSQYKETQEAFTRRMQTEVRKRTAWKCDTEVLMQKSFEDPLVRANTDPWQKYKPTWNEEKAWDEYVQYHEGLAI